MYRSVPRCEEGPSRRQSRVPIGMGKVCGWFGPVIVGIWVSRPGSALEVKSSGEVQSIITSTMLEIDDLLTRRVLALLLASFQA